MARLLFLLIILCVYAQPVVAQVQQDSLSLLHSPRKATILSAVLPGAGQAYNKKYWKIPIIYAGFTALGYFVVTNNNEYSIYKDAYKTRLDGNEFTVDEFVGIYADEDLVTLKNYYRRNRDLSVIGIGLLYVLNIIDATVDAHLFHFNVSDELGLNITPGYLPGQFAGPAISLNFQF
ncbi:MAG: DUF5683 domain-containing protein [Bacteroidota bacterium]|nr:DUF5683 domain-containing protein [Bacteroidota bacterium]